MRGGSSSGFRLALIGAALSLNIFGFLQNDRALAHAGTSPPSEDVPPEPGAAEQAVARRCVGELRLVASVFNEARPQLSLAVVRNRGGARVLTVGARLDDLVLVALQPHYAELRASNGELCILPVFDASLRSSAAPTPQVAAKVREVEKPSAGNADPKPKALITQEELQKGIHALGGGDYSLSKELLLKALKNPGGAAAGAYFKQVERDGHGVGMEVRAVREGTTLNRMGIRTGDVMRSVNGIDLSTPLGLLDALRAARESETVTLTIVREGSERALRYMIN